MKIESLIKEIEQFQGTEEIVSWYREKVQSNAIIPIEKFASAVNTAVNVQVSKDLSSIEQHYLIALSVLACRVTLRQNANAGDYYLTVKPFGPLEEIGKKDLDYFLQSMLLSVITKYYDAFKEGSQDDFELSLKERLSNWNSYWADSTS